LRLTINIMGKGHVQEILMLVMQHALIN